LAVSRGNTDDGDGQPGGLRSHSAPPDSTLLSRGDGDGAVKGEIVKAKIKKISGTLAFAEIVERKGKVP
jgi:hypothetical protein